MNQSYNHRIINNFGRREEVLERMRHSAKLTRPSRRAISEVRAQNGNFIGTVRYGRFKEASVKLLFLFMNLLMKIFLANTNNKNLSKPVHMNEEIERELVSFK